MTLTIGDAGRDGEGHRVLEADAALGLVCGDDRLGRGAAVGEDLELDAGVRVPALRLRDVEPGVVRVRGPVEGETDLRGRGWPTRGPKRSPMETPTSGADGAGERRRRSGSDDPPPHAARTRTGTSSAASGGAGAAEGDGHGRAVPRRDRIAAPGCRGRRGTERACFLHRYEPDQVPRVCGHWPHSQRVVRSPEADMRLCRASLHRGPTGATSVAEPSRAPAVAGAGSVSRSQATTSARTASCSGSWCCSCRRPSWTRRVALPLPSKTSRRPERDDRVGRAVEDVGRHRHGVETGQQRPEPILLRERLGPRADRGRARAQRVHVDLRVDRRVVRAAVVGDPVRELQLRHDAGQQPGQRPLPARLVVVQGRCAQARGRPAAGGPARTGRSRTRRGRPASGRRGPAACPGTHRGGTSAAPARSSWRIDQLSTWPRSPPEPPLPRWSYDQVSMPAPVNAAATVS